MSYVENEDNLSPFAMVIDPGNGSAKKQIHIENPQIEPSNAIKMELVKFHDSIVKNEPTPVGILDGYTALEVAYKVMEQIDESLYFFS